MVNNSNPVYFDIGFRGEKLLCVCGRLFPAGVGLLCILNWYFGIELSIMPDDYSDNVDRVCDALDSNRAAGVFCPTSARRRELSTLLVSQYFDSLQIPLIV